MSLFDTFNLDTTSSIFNNSVETLKSITFDEKADASARVEAAKTLINITLGVNEYLERKALAESFETLDIAQSDSAAKEFLVDALGPAPVSECIDEAELVEEGESN